MKDTHETNLPAEEVGKLEEAKAPVATPEKTAEENGINEVPKAEETTEETSVVKVDTPLITADEEDSVVEGKLSKDEILEKLAELVNAATDVARNEVDALKQAYYKLHRNEVDELKRAFIEKGGEEKDFVPPVDETESRLKELLLSYKEKRAALLAEEEREKAANYAQKLQLIDQLKELTESQDDFNKLYNKFKEIQQRWKEIKLIPQEHANELWKNYQMYSEKFYDIIKINNQFRDYDFKKNLELKTALCETVEKLETEPDVVSAFHQLQKLHQQWREIGPVAKELREDLWARFKAASTVINKRHQAYFESLKAKEKENLEAKTAICEQLESIDFASLKSFKDWDDNLSPLSIVDISMDGDNVRFSVVQTSGVTPAANNISVDAFQDAAIISWKSNISTTRTAWLTGSWDSKEIEVSPYSAGKYSCTIEGLSPGKEYTLSIRFRSDTGEYGEKVSEEFTTRRLPASNAFPYISFPVSGKAGNGSFVKGTLIPLRVINATAAESIVWSFNGQTITAASDGTDDGYYSLDEDGELKAEVIYPDGIEIIKRSITIR